MLKRGSALFFLFFCYFFIPCVSGDVPATDNWQTIFNSNGFEVQLAITAPRSDNCADPYRFKYRKKGANSQAVFLVWEIDYTGCDNNIYTKQVSYRIKSGERYRDWMQVETLDADFAFKAKELLSNPSPAKISSVAINSVQKQGPQKSVAPTSIAGDASVLFGATTRLSVSGGSLKPGSAWVWYEGGCGGKEIGRGAAISFTPGQKTIVYVRAEGKNDLSTCASIIINVDRNSVMAEKIIGDDHICMGEATKLLVQGGHLGVDAQWVWYTGDCGLERVGTGSTLLVNPTGNTRYFVRAEGRYNSTPCKEFVVNVSVPMMQPMGIKVDKKLVCQGEMVQLWVTGGPGSPSGQWHWTTQVCEGKTVAIGQSVRLQLQETTTFFVRGVSGCNQTDCRSITVEVIPKLYDPGTIKTSFPVYVGQETTLSVSPNPLLGVDTRFLWFKNDCDKNPLGSGKSIVVKPRVPTTYFVKAITECNESICKSVKVYPIPAQKQKTQVPGRQVFVMGYGLGFAYHSFLAEAEQTQTGSFPQTTEIQIDNLGFRTDLSLHPVFTDYFGIGLNASVGVGTAPSTLLRENSTTRVEYNYFEQAIGGEVFLGTGWAKLLVTQMVSVQKNDYLRRQSLQGKYERVVFDKDLYRQSFGAGIRLGRSIGRPKRTLSVDILYQTELRGPTSFTFLRNPFEAHQAGWHGLTLALRAKNTHKAGITLLFPRKGADTLKFEGKPLLNISWNIVNI